MHRFLSSVSYFWYWVYLDISFDNLMLDNTLQGQAVPLISEIGRQLPFGVFLKPFLWPLLILFTRWPWPLLWYWFQSFLSTASFTGPIISKCLCRVLNFFQITNINTSDTSKNEYICSFYGRIHGLTVCFRN